TSTEQRTDLADQRALGQAVAIFLGQEHGHAKCTTARNDGNLVDGIVLRHDAPDDGVTRLVISGVELLFLGHDHGFALGAHHDLVLGEFELLHLDDALAGPRREQRSLVDQVGQVGTGEARRATCDQGRFDAVTQRHLAHVHLEDLLATTDVRQPHHHLAVETARTQQRRVEHIGTVGRSDDDDAVVHLEAVHLHQQLVEGLLTLVVTATQTGATVATHGVDLVDEDDAGRMLLGLLEHVAHAAGTHANEHFDEVGTGDGEEGNLGLARHGLGQQRLAGARRADHQHATRNAAPQALEFARIAQELDQLGHLFLGLVATGHVGKGGLDLVFGKQARLALAKAHRPTLATGTTLHLAHEEHEHRDDHQDREAGHQQLGPDALLLRLRAFDQHVVVYQIPDQAIVLDRRTDGLEGFAIAALADDHVTIDGHALDTAFLDLLKELGIVERLRLGRAGEVVHHRHEDRGDDQPQDQVFCHVVQIHYPLEQTAIDGPRDGPC